MKKIMAGCLSAFILLSAGAAFAQPYVEEVMYANFGLVYVELADDFVRGDDLVWTKSEKVEVRDSAGMLVEAGLRPRDGDSLDIFLPKVKDGERYSFKLSGLSFAGKKKVSLSSWFKATPDWKAEFRSAGQRDPYVTVGGIQVSGADGARKGGGLRIEEMEFKRGGRLEVEFQGVDGSKPRIAWSGSEKVTVRDTKGKEYPVSVIEREKDGLKLGISGLAKGGSYRLTVEGVAFDGKKLTLTGDFVARNGWKMERQ